MVELARERAPVPRLCLLPTASGDQTAQVTAFYEAFGARACEPSHLSLFRLGSEPVDPHEHLLAQDAIYVGGGSLRNLLAIWRAHELDRVLVEAWRRGIVLAGVSAGAMCWFAAGVTTSSGTPEPAPGLGVLGASLSVHLDSEPARRPVFAEAVRSGRIPPGWAVDDGAALLFDGTTFVRALSARPGAGAVRVERDGTVTPLGVDALATTLQPRAQPSLDVLEMRSLRALRAR